MRSLKKGTGKRKELTKQEIMLKLKWFHGEEFYKYPLNDDMD